ncbi:MAG: glucoamylase family protein, partial [Burkholderiaceae bacterium]
GASAVHDLAHQLELHYLANPEAQAQFAMLSDWVDADKEQRDDDTKLLDAAVAAIHALNQRYPAQAGMAPRFTVLHRARQFSVSEQRWIGWERKRGKLESLIAALATGTRGPFLDLAQASHIAADTRYIVTLDSDTQLPPGRLRDIVGVAAHPNNLPRLDTRSLRVVEGYGILQPRVATPLPARQDRTLFHWLFAGQCGVDPYSAASSEVYQDLFGEGSFSGKGLLHVQALHSVLSGRLPEGQVLSHDLLEGAIARCANVTDITLFEEAPFHADVAASRLHRWMRGDWQLLPFLIHPKRYPLSTINRWKMLDNLRRSLVAPMSLLLLLLALAGMVVAPLPALALVIAAFSAGPLMGAIAGFSPSRDAVAKLHFYRQAALGLARTVWGAAWHLAQLQQQALLSLDAITRGCYRMAISRRHLLQWTTAEAAQARAQTALPALLRRHWRQPAVAAALLGALLALHTPFPGLAVLLCLVWGASPVWTWWASRPSPGSDNQTLSARERANLLAIARDTWRFFERCVGAADNHLPPDNLQTLPHEMLAHRTSPTNIGLYLLSVACARAFGWITTPELLTRLEASLATLGRLQRHRGHFLNWYDTQSCAPLLPMYVSTVDSGNLCGHLLAVAQACRELAARRAREAAHPTARLVALADSLEKLAWEPEFGFLYHTKRRLLHIGYRVAEQQLDAGFYDLLASESRLTSLLAIAKGDVPARHWAALERPFFAVGTAACLRSWSGSMFEYLMPTLVLDEPVGSALHGACLAAIQEQRNFARRQGVPWGISESAYAASDHTLAYQYAPQGVPRLAVRRTPPDELVVAPYATALAAPLAPRLALVNFRLLQSLAPRTSFGFIEALDFTPARQSADAPFTPVCTFMAHHQGMSLVALANLLLGGVAQRWGMASPHIKAVASLLHERTPREVNLLHETRREPAALVQRRRAAGLLRDVLPGSTAVQPTHVLSNGRYTVTLRPNGSGWSRSGQIGITRWRDDALRDACGSFFYLRLPGSGSDPASGRIASITQHPAPDNEARYQSTYHADRVCFEAEWPGIQAHTTVWVSPEDDVEFRQIELRNLGEESIDIELLSAFEVSLADPRADESHPAFGNLFVECHWHAHQQALVFARKPRLDTENPLQAAHFLADVRAEVLEVSVQADRQRWLGRNRAASHPLADMERVAQAHTSGAAQAESVALQTGLDPACVLAVRVRIAPQGKSLLTFATAASTDGNTLHAVIDKYRQSSHVQRASLMSATLAAIRLRSMRLSSENFAAIQNLTTALTLSLTRAPANPGVAQPAPQGASCDQRVLWRLGISGDRPVLLVWATVIEGLGLLRVMVHALRLW